MPLSPELFKRLSRLNRRRLADQVRTGDQVAPGGPNEATPPKSDADAVTLESVLAGTECRSGRGRCYRIGRGLEGLGAARAADGPADGAEPDARRLLAAYHRAFFGGGLAVRPEDLHEALRPLVEVDPAGITYLDIETCGLAGEPLFLVGLMRCPGRGGETPPDGVLRIDQFLARDYSEEAAMLEHVWRELEGAECLVTFNGKSFDMPTVEARSAACGLFDRPAVERHVDLLHEARRRWKRELPNCRLQTVEQLVCGRRRVGDIPGCDIPAAYHEFVRSQRSEDAVRRAASVRRLQTILHHNALDLVTMAELAAGIVGGSL